MFILNKNLKEIEELMTENNLIMCHGCDGCGKSSIAEELSRKYPQGLVINLQLSEIDYMSLAIAIGKPISAPTENLNYFIDYLAKTVKKTIIFTNVLSCSAKSFSTLVNLIKSSRYFYSTTVIGFYNDIKLLTHCDREQFEEIFQDFEQYKVSVEKESFSDIYNYIRSKTHKNLAEEVLKQFLEYGQYNLRAVTQVVSIYDPQTSANAHGDFDATRIKLLSANIKNRLAAFEESDKNLILQTAAVGFQFNTEFIKMCFNIAQIDAILLGIMNYDKQLYVAIKENTFSFFNKDTRDCVYGMLTNEQKIHLNKQIADFCYDQSQKYTDIFEKINYLNLAYAHYKETDENKKIYVIGCKLLKLYEYIGDTSNIIEICRELPDFGDQDEKYFLLAYFSYTLMQCDKYTEANSVIEKLNTYNTSLCRAATHRYLDLNYTKNLYLSSAEPYAYKKSISLKNSAVHCTDAVYLTQLYSLLYSIYDNRGDYVNSVKNEKQAYFYALKCKNQLYLNQLYLKSQINKADEIISKNLLKAKNYFSKTCNYDLLAQANHNYGSEMIFANKLSKAHRPLTSAYTHYKEKGSVWSVYPLNNLAILDILNHKYKSALNKLSKPFPCGTELFTKITVLCNKLVCYIKMGKLSNAENVFAEISEGMRSSKEESESFYLKIYVKLMEGLILYHKNQINKAEKILKDIEVPTNYPFLNEFINGLCAKIHGKEINYKFPYIEVFVKEDIYLCDFLFIE